MNAPASTADPPRPSPPGSHRGRHRCSPSASPGWAWSSPAPCSGPAAAPRGWPATSPAPMRARRPGPPPRPRRARRPPVRSPPRRRLPGRSRRRGRRPRPRPHPPPHRDARGRPVHDEPVPEGRLRPPGQQEHLRGGRGAEHAQRDPGRRGEAQARRVAQHAAGALPAHRRPHDLEGLAQRRHRARPAGPPCSRTRDTRTSCASTTRERRRSTRPPSPCARRGGRSGSSPGRASTRG